jgi:hypothetical protein
MGNTADILCTSLACTSGGKFQVRVATSGLIVKFTLMICIYQSFLIVVAYLSLQTAVERNNKRHENCQTRSL